MANLPTTETEFDTNLNRLDSLLQGLGITANVAAGSIESGVFGSSNKTNGIEFGVSPSAKTSYIQSRNFVLGTAGWQILSDGTVEFGSGTFRGTLSAASGTLGTITAGTFTGVSITATTIQNASSGARVVIGDSTNEIKLYYDADDISSIVGAENELRLRMEKVGGYVTLYSEDTEVLRADKQDGVTIPASLMLTTYRLAVNKTGATAGISAQIDNAGTSNSLIINQTYASNSSIMFQGSNGGTGKAAYFTNSLATNTDMTVEIDHAGTGGCLALYASNNGSHLYFLGDPTVATPADGEMWFDGTNLKMRIGAATFNIDMTAV